MPLDPRIEAIREQYGLDRDSFWELPQKKGTWLVKHSALEIVAAKAGIKFSAPQIIEAHGEAGIAAVCVTGELDGRSVWSIGECSPKNNKNAYPWAMAEKRALDRVILKLSGIHGLVYSEEEMAGDQRGGDAPTTAPARISSYLAKKVFKTDVLLEEIDTAKSDKRCDEIQATVENELSFLPASWTAAFIERLDARRAELTKSITNAVAANDSLDRQFAETVGK
jgi:hypothetical protein